MYGRIQVDEWIWWWDKQGEVLRGRKGRKGGRQARPIREEQLMTPKTK